MIQIEILNKKLLSLIDECPLGLANGKMGLCIYFYYLSRMEKKDEFKIIAENLFDDVINNLSETTNISFESGLAGIAIGISHLVKEKFVEGDINEVLEDIDSCIFRKLVFYDDKVNTSPNHQAIYIQLLYYLYIRYKAQTSYDEKFIFQELMIKIIEKIKNNIQVYFLYEHLSFSINNFHLPTFLYIISKIYNLNIYNTRIIKILEEYINQILSIIPILHANRLYLLWGLINIKECLPAYKKEIDSQIHILRGIINIDKIINIELRDQDIYIINGVSIIYILLFIIQIKYPEYRIDYSPQSFHNRISNTKALNLILNRKLYFYEHSGLINGFPGAYLVLLHIKNTIHEI